jgi:hypothetical protein
VEPLVERCLVPTMSGADGAVFSCFRAAILSFLRSAALISTTRMLLSSSGKEVSNMVVTAVVKSIPQSETTRALAGSSNQTACSPPPCS